jgi:3-dehydroquinate dehydratase/shikimate dehydrogenase
MLIQRAKQEGTEVLPGIEMFIEQAVQQFQTWTTETAPRAVMQKAALEALGAAVPLSA